MGRFAAETGVRARVAHLPVHCSKYNPIERRASPHVERAWRGRTFATIEGLAAAARTASTREGLTTTAHVIEETFEPARAGSKTAALDDLPLTRDEILPEYNYAIAPPKNGQ